MNEKMIKLIIDSDIKNVSLIGAVVNRLCTLAPFSDIEIYQIELCVVESVNNIIQHAYNSESWHEVNVVFTLYDNRISFEICDFGKNMKSKYFLKKCEPSFEFDPDDIEKLPESGMGLLIIHQIMDGVVYTSSNGINKLTLTKFFSAEMGE